MNSAFRSALGIGNIEIEALQNTVLKRYMIYSSQLHSSQKIDFRKGDRISVIKHSILDNHVSFETDDLSRMGKWYAFRPHVKIHGEVIKVKPNTELLTFQQLADIAIHTPLNKLRPLVEPINETLAKYEINTPLRIVHFLAQIAHESDGFKALEEYASGEDYEWREDLGNTQKGDGVRFKGRGLICVTGRFNYNSISKDLGVDFVGNPRLLADPKYSALSAGWFWDREKLNLLADRDDLFRITQRVNGGQNGALDRQNYLRRAKKALGV